MKPFAVKDLAKVDPGPILPARSGLFLTKVYQGFSLELGTLLIELSFITLKTSTALCFFLLLTQFRLLLKIQTFFTRIMQNIQFIANAILSLSTAGKHDPRREEK